MKFPRVIQLVCAEIMLNRDKTSLPPQKQIERDGY
jgi:hypothetical protein